MNAEVSNDVLFKTRSLLGRMSVAFKFINSNLKYLLKYGSLISLPVSLVVAIYTTYFRNMPMLSVSYWLSTLFASLAFFIGVVLFSSFIFTSFQKYIEFGYVPAYKFSDMKALMLQNTKKILGVMFVYILVFLLLMAVIGGLAMLSIYTLIITIPLALFLFVPLVYLPNVCIFEGKGIFESFKKSCGLGVSNWGATFTICLLLYALVSIIQAVAGLPWLAGLFVEYVSGMSLLQGDEANLPGFFRVLMCLLSLIAFYIGILSNIITLVPLMFQYGSAETSRKEKEENI